jgi:hypothetical protein
MQPAGWWVKDKKNREHFYNQYGFLEATDDNDSDGEQKEKQSEPPKQTQ